MTDTDNKHLNEEMAWDSDTQKEREVDHYKIVHKDGSVVGKAKTAKGARKSLDTHDNNYGGYAHKIKTIFKEDTDLNEQTHVVRVTYSDKHEDAHKMSGDFERDNHVRHTMHATKHYKQNVNVSANSMHQAVNKAALHITKQGFRLHSAVHAGLKEGIVYSDTSEPFSNAARGNLSKINPNKAYKTHLENHHYLSFIQKNSKDAKEKIQCTKELGTAERKMNYWKRHPEFSKKQQEDDHAEVKKKWNVKEEVEMGLTENKFAPKKLRDIVAKPAKRTHEYKGNTEDEKAIVAKYADNTVVLPDYNGNGDDVFKASKITRTEKEVEPGEDEKKYDEWNNGARKKVNESKTTDQLQSAVRKHSAAAFKSLDKQISAGDAGDEKTADEHQKKTTRHLNIVNGLYKKYPHLK